MILRLTRLKINEGSWLLVLNLLGWGSPLIISLTCWYNECIMKQDNGSEFCWFNRASESFLDQAEWHYLHLPIINLLLGNFIIFISTIPSLILCSTSLTSDRKSVLWKRLRILFALFFILTIIWYNNLFPDIFSYSPQFEWNVLLLQNFCCLLGVVVFCILALSNNEIMCQSS